MNQATKALRHLETVIQYSGHMIGTEFRDIQSDQLMKVLERLSAMCLELSADNDIQYALFVNAFKRGMMGLTPQNFDHENDSLD